MKKLFVLSLLFSNSMIAGICSQVIACFTLKQNPREEYDIEIRGKYGATYFVKGDYEKVKHIVTKEYSLPTINDNLTTDLGTVKTILESQEGKKPFSYINGKIASPTNFKIKTFNV